MTHPPHDPAGSPRPSQQGSRPVASSTRRTLCALLVAVPVFLALCVPLYQRTTPELAGVPFFFWFQMLMAVAAACACGTTYLLLFRHESEND